METSIRTSNKSTLLFLGKNTYFMYQKIVVPKLKRIPLLKVSLA